MSFKTRFAEHLKIAAIFFLVIVIVINIIIISNFIIKATISSIKGGNKDSRTEGREHGQWKNHGFN